MGAGFQNLKIRGTKRLTGTTELMDFSFHVKGFAHLYLLYNPQTLVFFKILFPYRPVQSTEYSSLHYTAGPYQYLSILYIVVCICQFQSPNLSLPHLSPGNHKFVFYSHDSISVV